MEWLARASSARPLLSPKILRGFIDMPYSLIKKTLDRDRHFVL
jgi:hypothetical protein